MQPLVAAVDVGATHIRVALVQRGKIILREEIHTHEGATEPSALLGRIADLVMKLSSEIPTQPEALGICFPGPTNGDTGVVRTLPNVPGWRYPHPVLKFLRREFPDLAVAVDNDVNAHALAEHLYGHGQGLKSQIHLSVGTGIGGGIVIGGKLYRGANGLAAELGHTIIQMDGPPCNCGQRGCLEALASGTAISRMARAMGHTGETKELIEAVNANESWILEIFAKASEALGLGLLSLANTFDPEAFTLAGGLMKYPDLMLSEVPSIMNSSTTSISNIPVWVSQLGDDIGLLGAAALAVQAYEEQNN